MVDLTTTIHNLTSTQTSTSASVTSTCDTCGGKRTTTIEILGKTRRVPCLCSCEAAAWETHRIEEERRKKMKSIEKLRRYSLIDERFAACTLDQWQDDIGSTVLKETVLRYINKWPAMKAGNVGLLIHGSPGIGKSHATFTVANELIQQYRAVVVAVSSIGLLSRIKETYVRYGQEAEIDILNTLKSASLLLIDDLGAEQKTDWSTAMLYQIIDSRYRSNKPLFITTNLNLGQLREKLTLEDGVDRTYDRIMEMCLPVEVSGPSNRAKAARSKRQRLMETLRQDR